MLRAANDTRGDTAMPKARHRQGARVQDRIIDAASHLMKWRTEPDRRRVHRAHGA